MLACYVGAKIEISVVSLYDEFGSRLQFSHSIEISSDDKGIEYYDIVNEHFDKLCADGEINQIIEILSDRIILENSKAKFQLALNEFDVAVFGTTASRKENKLFDEIFIEEK